MSVTLFLAGALVLGVGIFTGFRFGRALAQREAAVMIAMFASGMAKPAEPVIEVTGEVQ